MAEFDWAKAAEPEEDFDWQTAAKPRSEVEPLLVEGAQTAPPPSISKATTALYSGGKGLSVGLTPTLSGVAGAFDEAGRRMRSAVGLKGDYDVPVENESLSFLDALGKRYSREKGDYITDADKAAKANPGTALTTGLAGSLMAPVPSVGLLKGVTGLGGVAARLGLNSAMGAGVGVVSETGEANPNYKRAAAFGAGAGLGGGLLGETVSKIARFFSGKAAKATEDALERGITNKAETVASAVGAKGGVTQTANRAIENIENLFEHGTPEQKTAVAEFLASPGAAELRQQILSNSLERAKQGLTNISAADEALKAAKAIDPTLFSKESAWGTAKRAVLPRVETLLTRSVPAAVGSAVGGPLGGIAGGITSGAMGKPGTIATNLFKDPNFRRHTFNALNAMTPEALANRSTVPLSMLAAELGDLAEEDKESKISPIARYFGGE